MHAFRPSRPAMLHAQALAFSATSNRDSHTNGYANDQTAIRRCPPQKAFSSAAAAASAADVVYEEQDDFVDPLMQIPQAVDRGGKGEDKDEVELPFSTLWQMQLDREDQSHQEACEKYGKVRMVATMRGARCRRGVKGGRGGGARLCRERSTSNETRTR